jgi:sarcosine oxidase
LGLKVSTPRSYKLIILGASGLVGSSAFYQASKITCKNSSSPLLHQAAQVLGLDQYPAGHAAGSSHGESRITRLAIGEGMEYVTLAKRSHVIWQEVEKQLSGDFGKLLNIKSDNQTGGLIIGPASEKGEASYHGSAGGFLQQSKMIADINNVKHQLLSNSQLKQTFPQFAFRADDVGYCEDTMGYINPDACIKANLALAKQHGGELRDNEKVLGFSQCADGKIKLTTSKAHVLQEYFTDKLIIAAGPWLNNLVETQNLQVMRQTVYWFRVRPEAREDFMPARFPTFIWNLDSKNIIYGFPLMVNAEAIKISTESYTTVTTPESVDRTVSAEEIACIHDKFIKPYFPAVTSQCVKSQVCLYTVAPKWRFVIDFHPDFDEKIIVASPCSGHGAKHAAAIGEALAQRSLLSKSDIDVIELFKGLELRVIEKESAQLRTRFA